MASPKQKEVILDTSKKHCTHARITKCGSREK